jgi:hypothetical protein
MATSLYIHASSLRSSLQTKYSEDYSLFSSTYDTKPENLINIGKVLKDFPDLLEYWSCIFLLSCEDFGPCFPKIKFEVFLENLEWALYGVCTENNPVLPLYVECIDTLLANEIIELDEMKMIEEVSKILELMTRYEEKLGKFEYLYKKRAGIAIDSLWGKFGELNNGKPPSREVFSMTNLLVIAHSAGIDVKELASILADWVFEYVDLVTNYQLNSTSFKQEQGVIQECHELILMLEYITNDEEVKNNIQEYKGKLDLFYKYVPPVHVDPNDYPLNLDIYFIEKNLVVITQPSKYTVTRGNVRTSIHDGFYYETPVCVKIYTSTTGNLQELSKAVNEIKIYEQLSVLSKENNCFLTYYGSFIDGPSIYMIMDLYQINLMDLINNLKEQKYVFQELMYLQIIWKLLESFSVMAFHGILHNDIKPHNMLADNDWNIKIIDFDISLTKIQETSFSQSGVFDIQGTQGYLAPEQKKALADGVKKFQFNREKADVYSLGLVFYQLLLFKSVENLTTAIMYADIENYPNFSSDTKRFLKTMLLEDPSNRPLFREALSLFKLIPETVSFTG